MKKPIIIAIVGLSGSGKTSLVEYLKKHLNIPTIVSYTTRPMREGEMNGREHYFVSEKDMPPRTCMLAYTLFGGYHYWAQISQVPKNICTYVIDEKGLNELCEQFGHQYKIVPILIKRNKKTLQNTISPERLKRDAERIVIEDKMYQDIIENDGTLEEFYDKALQIINTLK